MTDNCFLKTQAPGEKTLGLRIIELFWSDWQLGREVNWLEWFEVFAHTDKSHAAEHVVAAMGST